MGLLKDNGSITTDIIEWDIKTAEFLCQARDESEIAPLQLAYFHATQAIEKTLKLRLQEMDAQEADKIWHSHHTTSIFKKVTERSFKIKKELSEYRKHLGVWELGNNMRYGQYATLLSEADVEITINAAKDIYEKIYPKNKGRLSSQTHIFTEQVNKLEESVMEWLSEQEAVPMQVGKANPEDGAKIISVHNSIRKDEVRVDVLMLSPALKGEREPNGNDVCSLIVANGEVYLFSEWKSKGRSPAKQAQIEEDGLEK